MTHTQAEFTQIETGHAPFTGAIVSVPFHADIQSILEKPGPTIPELITSWLLSRRSDRTRETYLDSLRYFVEFLRVPNLQAAIEVLIMNPGHSNIIAAAFQEWLRQWRYLAGKKDCKHCELRPHIEGKCPLTGTKYCQFKSWRGLSNSSVNGKVSALKSLCDYISKHGVGISIALKVDALKTKEPDITGPSRDEVQAMIDMLKARTDAKGARDRAIIYLFMLNALRKKELIGMNFSDFCGDSILIVAKGSQGERKRITIRPAVRRAIEKWIEIRGQHEGPLFVSFDATGKEPTRITDKRITGSGLIDLIGRLSMKAFGRRITVHMLRHSSCTLACKLTDNNLISVQRFARHADPKTTENTYISRATDEAGKVSRLLEGAFDLS